MTSETPVNVPQGTQAGRGGCCGPAGSAPASARDILDCRYASGEITAEQYDAMRDRIASDSGQPRGEVKP